MPSTFTWLDYSERDRNKMMEVVAMFNEKETRDELGIGAVRDGFADLFFPGTGTVQTRARYFLFVPWIYLNLESSNTQSSRIAARARQFEISLINTLVASDPDGTIGRLAREQLQRLPSNIYWLGLGKWGIRLFQGSQDEYHRSLDRFYERARGVTINDDKEPVDGRMLVNWRPGLPAPPPDFPQTADFKLTFEEAAWLQERIRQSVPDSLMAYLVSHGEVCERGDFPWEHPQFGEFPPHISDQMNHARCFSEVIHGAALLYNLMLAEKTGNGDWIDLYEKKMADWADLLESRGHVLMAWDRHRFWEILANAEVRITSLTRMFIDSWVDQALHPGAAPQIAKHVPARSLVQGRERQLKRALARLDNPRSLEQWQGAAGTRQLTYRWDNAQTIILDILDGLTCEVIHA